MNLGGKRGSSEWQEGVGGLKSEKNLDPNSIFSLFLSLSFFPTTSLSLIFFLPKLVWWKYSEWKESGKKSAGKQKKGWKQRSGNSDEKKCVSWSFMSLCKPIWLKREGKKKEIKREEKRGKNRENIRIPVHRFTDLSRFWREKVERKRIVPSSFLLIPPRFHHLLFLEKTRFLRNLYTLIPSLSLTHPTFTLRHLISLPSNLSVTCDVLTWKVNEKTFSFSPFPSQITHWWTGLPLPPSLFLTSPCLSPTLRSSISLYFPSPFTSASLPLLRAFFWLKRTKSIDVSHFLSRIPNHVVILGNDER